MIAETFIKRPVTAIVISVVIVIVGILAITSLPIGQYPEITPPTVTITGTYTGADALTVEQTVATPIETQVNGTPGMTYLQSNSTNNGALSMTANFEVGTDINIAALDVQNRVGIATPTLPQEVQRLGLTVRKKNPSILMLVAIYSPTGAHSVTYLDNYANVFIKDALLRAKGVGDVVSRADDFSMRIWLKPDKLASLGMTAADVTAALNEQNAQVAAGTVGATPQEHGQTFEYSVLVKGRLTDPSEFGNVIVRTQPGTGAVVHLKDVARVELGKFNYAGNSFVDGKRASYLLVYQAPNSNAIETADAVYQTMADLKKAFPPGVDYVVPFEAITVVKVSVAEVIQTLVIALFLVIVVVFLFLQSWRTTLIPILAIPVSIIGTFIFFIPLHFTINTLTLFGFVLAIGIVVDDAIVVVEAVQHYMDEKGMSAKDATTHAMQDISAPVIAIALILASVFVPVGFIPGIVGKLYQQFAITIAISVIISAFIALSLTPALCTLLLKPTAIKKDAKGLNGLFYKFNTWFDKITANYTEGVRKSIKGSRYVVILLLCICIGAYFLFQGKPSGFIPSEDDGNLYVTFQLPPAASTAQSVELMTKLMKVVGGTPGVAHYAALSGLNVVTNASNSNNGTIYCQLAPWDDRNKDDEQVPGIIGVLQKRIAEAGIKDAAVQVIQPSPLPGVGSTVGFSMQIEQRSTNDDIHAFEKVVNKFVAEANKNPAITKAFSFFTAHTPNYNLTVDREKCEKLGDNVLDVLIIIQAFMDSLYINDF